MKRSMFRIIAAAFAVAGFASAALAADAAKPYSGDVWNRSTLSGDWDGARNELAAKGVVFDLTLTQILQGIPWGGEENDLQYGGRGALTVNLDTGKLGWWPGGFFTVEVEGNFGNAVNGNTGALMAVNSNQLYPMPNDDQLNIPAVSFTQVVTKQLGLTVGKLDTTSGDMNAFAHGKGDTQFFNLALNFNPVALLTVPYSALGAGVIVAPTGDPDFAVVKLIGMDADGRANSTGFDTVFDGNTTYALDGRLRTDIGGLTGHQLLGGTYSTKDFKSLDQNTRLIVESGAIGQKSSSWSLYYNFDQYLYEPEKGSGQGVGIFGRLGASDGNPNPVRYFVSLGAGGKGIVPGRPLDTFGLGYYYINVSQPRFTDPTGKRTYGDDEQGFEMYYNVALAPWLILTPDLQFVSGAQNGANTATVPGLRLQMVF